MKEEKTIWNTKVTMRDLAKIADWKEILKSLKYYYPGSNWNTYQPAFERILKIRKQKQKDSKEEIEIIVSGLRFFTKDEDEREEFYYISTNLYSMSFRKWNEMSNITISRETIKHYTVSEILAHFIYEITWYGSEEESLKTGKEIFKSAKAIKKNDKS